MPALPELSDVESTLLFCAIILLLIPLLIWMFGDIERRRQRADLHSRIRRLRSRRARGEPSS